MKTTQSILLLAILLAASHAQAQEPAAAPQQNLTFPPQPVVSNQVYYPSVAMQQPQMAYPYAVQQPYAAPSYYYPYAQQQQAYRPYYYPYQQQQAYNPYMAQQQQMMPAYPMRPPVQQKKKEVKPWGDTRYIWPDFYTDFTGDAFDKMINAPYDMGRMPGGWQFPSISMPDPVTVSDAIANQVPPFAEEAGNMVPADDVGNIMPFK